MMESKTLKPIIWAVIITVFITFAISFLILKYIPDHNQNLKVNEYKKELYTSTLCQYSCPLSLQQAQNKTEYLPEQTCVNNCTKKFKEIQSTSEDISNSQIKNDGLINDMSSAISVCKNGAVDTKTMSLNNTLFFSCSVEKLSALKSKYSYLN